MKKILSVLFLLLCITSYSQTVKELEYELSYIKSDEEWGNKKDIALKLLEIDKLNESAFAYLVEAYGRNNQQDSINLLIDNIIKKNPKNPEPYLIIIQDRNANFIGLSHTQKINFLKEAYKLDSLNIETIYTLGKLFYELFIQEFKTNKVKENLDYYSTNGTQFLTILCNQNENYLETLKFPLLQLANYLGDENMIEFYNKNKIQSSYFPISAFVNFPNDWKTNYSVNVIDYVSESEFKVYGVESAIFHINWYSEHLKALDEPVLSDSLPTKVFRFTWLRTFDNPIVIGIENNKDSIILYWKVCDGEGGYEPGKIIENKRKKLTKKEWSKVVTSINSINFWNIPTMKNEMNGEDGAQWLLEGKELGKYHIVDRWNGGEIKKVCLQLLNLTDLKIEQGNIY